MKYSPEIQQVNAARTSDMVAKLSSLSSSCQTPSLKSLPRASMTMSALSIAGSATMLHAELSSQQMNALKNVGIEVKPFNDALIETFELYVTNKVKFNDGKNTASLIINKAFTNAEIKAQSVKQAASELNESLDAIKQRLTEHQKGAINQSEITTVDKPKSKFEFNLSP